MHTYPYNDMQVSSWILETLGKHWIKCKSDKNKTLIHVNGSIVMNPLFHCVLLLAKFYIGQHESFVQSCITKHLSQHLHFYAVQSFGYVTS